VLTALGAVLLHTGNHFLAPPLLFSLALVLSFQGTGKPVFAVVKMVRVDQDGRADGVVHARIGLTANLTGHEIDL
jgi:hypothetical protein